MLWLVVALLHAVPHVLGEQCSGTVALTESSGNISDHTVGFRYTSNANCRWTIDLPDFEYITLDFHHFATELKFDFLFIHEGIVEDAFASDTVMETLSGRTPAVLKYNNMRITSPSNRVTLFFMSDIFTVDHGFSLTYYGSNCATRCDKHGSCHGDTCECDAAFRGADCLLSTTSCPDGCVHGSCTALGDIGFICACQPGWHGPSCENPFCSSAILSSPSGSFSNVAAHVTELKPNAECTWQIRPPVVPGQSVSLRFTKFDMDGLSSLRIYDGENATAHLIAQYSGLSVPPAVVAHSGKMFVSYSAGGLAEGQPVPLPASFVATYAVSTCSVMDCSGHGDCVFAQCHCHIGYSGPDCAVQFCANDCSPSTGSTCNGTVCVCAEGWRGVDCGICDGDTCPPSCSGETRLSNRSASISSEVAGVSECSWIIAPAGDASSIAISFLELDLEYGEAYVRVGNEELLYGQFTGDVSPSPLIVQSDVVVLEYSSSDSAFTGSFVVNYVTFVCEDNCSGNGACVAEGTCHCHAGYTGVSCSVTECVGDCSAALSTDNSCASVDGVAQCSCAPGYFGVDCSHGQCYGIKTLLGRSGIIQDHAVGDTYNPFANCQWNIPVVSNTSYSFVFKALHTERNLDTVMVLDAGGRGMITSGLRVPLPFSLEFYPPFGSVVFQSDYDKEFAGFELAWSRDDECPMSCAGSGWCIDGRCHCYDATAGPSCTEDVEINIIRFDVYPYDGVPIVDHRTLFHDMTQYEWVYYNYTVPPDAAFTMEVRISTPGRDEFDTVMYAKVGGFPSLLDFDYRSYDSYMDIKMTGPGPGQPAVVWTFALFAYEDAPGVEIDIRALATADSPQPPSMQEDVETRFGFYSIFFLALGVVVLMCGCVLMFVKRTKAADLRAEMDANFNVARRNNQDMDGVAPTPM